LGGCWSYGVYGSSSAGNGSVKQTAFNATTASMTAYSFDSDAGGLQMFQIKEIVKPSGKGRTADWPEQVGTVTKVTIKSVFVQWHDCAVEDEMNFDELVSTGTFNDIVPVMVAELPPPEEKPPTIH
jgi:hypothetical protein